VAQCGHSNADGIKLVDVSRGNNITQERRDLAALLMLCGELGWAREELDLYVGAPAELQCQNRTEVSLVDDMRLELKRVIQQGAPLVPPPPPPPAIPW